ncbi:MAG TPA: hypothetical protein VL326_01975 [Kofleriaceae bacterium]|nr:hypothetical protein [Kofleriaceae bacterium]
MRLLLAAVILLVPVVASAERAVDYTHVRGALLVEGRYDELPGAVIPPHPSLIVHLGSDGPRGMPRFTNGFGAPIEVSLVTELQGGDWLNLYRVELDIDDGTVQVWLGDDSEAPVASYVIDPSFVPKTRSVEVRPSGGSLWVDSDAIAFRVEVGGRMSVWLQDGPHVRVDEGVNQVVTAIYPNGREETIFAGAPVMHDDPLIGTRAASAGAGRTPGFRIVPVLLAWLALGLFALVRRRTTHAE